MWPLIGVIYGTASYSLFFWLVCTVSPLLWPAPVMARMEWLSTSLVMRNELRCGGTLQSNNWQLLKVVLEARKKNTSTMYADYHHHSYYSSWVCFICFWWILLRILCVWQMSRSIGSKPRNRRRLSSLLFIICHLCRSLQRACIFLNTDRCKHQIKQ